MNNQIQQMINNIKINSENIASQLEYGNVNTGEPLDSETLSRLEKMFATDLSFIRIRISELPYELNAKAFTHGTDIYILPDEYESDKLSGSKLILHEVAHVIQQLRGDLLDVPEKELQLVVNSELEDESDEFYEVVLNNVAQVKGSVKFHKDNVNWSVVLPQLFFRTRNLSNNEWDLHPFEGSPATVLTRIIKELDSSFSHAELRDYIKANRTKILSVLSSWMKSSTSRVTRYVRGQNAESRVYDNNIDLAKALAGEVRSDFNMAREKILAIQVKNSLYIRNQLDSLLVKLGDVLDYLHKADLDQLPKLKGIVDTIYSRTKTYKGTYYHYYRRKGIKSVITNPNSTTSIFYKVAAIHDIEKVFRKMNPESSRVPYSKNKCTILEKNNQGKYTRRKLTMQGTNDFRWGVNNSGLRKYLTLKETSPFIESARLADMPAHMGPSYTSGRMFQMCEHFGATVEEISAVAWALFAFWNLEYSHKETRVHRFHFVMDMAQNYGVTYRPFVYPTQCPDQRHNGYNFRPR
ncbi:eCIS core domain-containing protein [Vibrio marisflavi]|nr:DUF4157 domain-containing protein [Vibrio marisflavi]